MQASGIGPQHWQLPEPVQLPEDYLPDFSDLTRTLVWRRGVTSAQAAHYFLFPKEFQLPPSGTYQDLGAAADRLQRAIAAHERVCVWGDFDVDGQTATAILVEALLPLNAAVDYYIPDRIRESHGLNADGIQRLADAGTTLIVTCDCATNDVRMVELAGERGIDVVISDHHQQVLPAPNAVAICNSSHVAREDPLWGIPGAGMAYMVVRELYSRLGLASQMPRVLDLVALGIIADMAPLSIANRAFLARGLRQLWREPRPGVKALLNLIGQPVEALDSAKISFKLAPILNAAGRLSDARLGVRLLLTRDPLEASALADRLYSLNLERQRLTGKIESAIDASLSADVTEQAAIVAIGEGWHPGLIGPAASHYASRYRRPAAVITSVPGECVARGSVRSSGTHDVLSALASQSGLLLEWGGHPGASGFSIDLEHIPDFARGFVEAIASQVSGTSANSVKLDAEVAWCAIDEHWGGDGSIYAQLEPLAPFSEGNPAPVLMTRGLRLVDKRVFGRNAAFANLTFADNAGVLHAVKWWQHDASWLGAGHFDVAYTLSVDSWQGQYRIQLTLVAARPAV